MASMNAPMFDAISSALSVPAIWSTITMRHGGPSRKSNAMDSSPPLLPKKMNAGILENVLIEAQRYTVFHSVGLEP